MCPLTLIQRRSEHCVGLAFIPQYVLVGYCLIKHMTLQNVSKQGKVAVTKNTFALTCVLF
jgi:hypothetical protein